MTERAASGGPVWDFENRPLSRYPSPDRTYDDFIVASSRRLDPKTVRSAIPQGAGLLSVEPTVTLGPVLWHRVRMSSPTTARTISECLGASGIAVRYVASSRHGSLQLGEEFRPCSLEPKAGAWSGRSASVPLTPTPSCWSHASRGVCLDRASCGRGEDTRLAVIDDDAADLELANVDAEVLVSVKERPRAQPHGTLMVGWAVGTSRFEGIAPGASARLYVIPKPGVDVVSLPLAIIRAAADGADVILCPSYLEGTTSPMLDDALEFASRFGRGGLGSVIVVPTGREASSPPDSSHVSWSIGLGEPASDPRILCVGPSGRNGGWFLWEQRKGGLRPFANRGPAVRFLAPGDDMTSPLRPSGASHAESSGASAVAAGVALVVIASNPGLSKSEVEDVLKRSAIPAADETDDELSRLTDPWDAMPARRDADGHNAKYGYGRLQADRACLMVSDPFCAALVQMGHPKVAARWLDMRRSDPSLKAAYSVELGLWMARQCLARSEVMHTFSVLARHLRLVAIDIDRLRAHGTGALLRQLLLALRTVPRAVKPPEALLAELNDLCEGLSQSLANPARCGDAEHAVWRLAQVAFGHEDADVEG